MTSQPQVRLHRSHLPTFYCNIKVCSVTATIILNHGQVLQRMFYINTTNTSHAMS